MMLRDLANNAWGEQTMRPGCPRVEAYFDAYLVPAVGFPDNDPLWGVYRSDGKLIEAAAHKRGPGRLLLGQSETLGTSTEFHTVDGPGIYGGLTIPHFGHYLLSTLSRYWTDLRADFPGSKIYIHTMEDLGGWLARPFVRQTLSALGFQDSDFVPIDRPMRLRHLIVPASSFIEQSVAFQAYGETGRLVGERLCGAPPKVRSEPVYLSKEQLAGGVWTADNESDLVEALREAGVRIVYPETLSLPEQTRIFAEHRTIIGLAGSALHTSLLSGGGHRLIGLYPTEMVNSNFLLIDKIKNNRSSYLTPQGGLQRIGETSTFAHVYRIPEPRLIARELLAQID
ncbi:glycosyltransferase family 61 protein [Methylobacterium gregans]|uniref:Glycosyltransferase 61 catalytic domain-containing protein n=1 Tax=Methylobacterium gregans TaxID=374424 RepID=A0AA37HP83_9HYPH|nr:glycosyltransferase family 61 protein [Methylobacterium gregans]MDQ0521781.1 hypothetical protein [Methylobacterium gregans]GJD79210.1 hypothetical protein NBEOAGPD_2433 [Methylobacterium gregans]GLS52153.1 hypothetical protein GCM10007886_03350 [Methylobacterium gregans]